MIESLYIVDSSGLCLYYTPLAGKVSYDPDLMSGFMITQQKSFKQLFGESTKVLKLQKRQFLLQNIDLKERNMLIAIAHEIGNEKEEKSSRAIIGDLVANLRSNRDRILSEPASVVTDAIHSELEAIVNKTLKGTKCIFFTKGFLAAKDQCERTSSPTGSRPCDFYYAVNQCERYNPPTG